MECFKSCISFHITKLVAVISAMKYYLPILFVLLVGCNSNIKYSDGGFDYPKNITDKDSNFYYYQLKNIESPKDAFRGYYTYLFYQAFDEPNLSIKPQERETFRLSYSATSRKSIIIILTEDFIIVKKGSPENLYDNDTSHLLAIEKFHLNLLNYRFPIDTTGKSIYVKHYLDSLIKLYPQLLDPAYYHKLYDKTLVRNENKFNYAVTKITLVKQQYDSLIQQINSSGFWSMPYKIDCKDSPSDGYGFTLEANTKKKYKVVTAGGCLGDTTKFTRACQRIIDIAKLDKEVNLVWDGKVDTVSLTLPDIKRK